MLFHFEGDFFMPFPLNAVSVFLLNILSTMKIRWLMAVAIIQLLMAMANKNGCIFGKNREIKELLV